MKILALANQRDIPIYTIDDTNIDAVLPQLNTFSIVKDNIRESVEKGWIAICPQRNITLKDWNGQGWLVIDSDSGAAGYLLAGHLVSGNTVEVINGGSATEATEETITGSAIGDFILHLHHWKALITVMAHMAIYWYLLAEIMCAGSAVMIIGAFWAFGLTVFLLLYVLAALWVYQHIWPFDSRIYRRRNIMYA